MNVRAQKLSITGEAHHCDGSPKLCPKYERSQPAVLFVALQSPTLFSEQSIFLSAYAVNDVNSFEAYKQIGPTLDRDGFECRFLCLAHDPSDRLDCLHLWARQVVALQDTFVLVRLWRAALLCR